MLVGKVAPNAPFAAYEPDIPALFEAPEHRMVRIFGIQRLALLRQALTGLRTHQLRRTMLNLRPIRRTSRAWCESGCLDRLVPTALTEEPVDDIGNRNPVRQALALGPLMTGGWTAMLKLPLLDRLDDHLLVPLALPLTNFLARVLDAVIAMTRRVTNLTTVEVLTLTGTLLLTSRIS